MAGTIKITSLTDIGATIPDTTLVPVVDMVPTPTTMKATLANVANAILSEAGNLYVVANTSENANIANIAGTVTVNAQPNITSLGTLTSFVANGNVTLGTVGNVHITGGTNGYILSTNGSGNLSWIAPANAAVWVSTPVSNVAPGSAGQVSYDAGGNLFVCVSTNTWSKITGTTSW